MRLLSVVCVAELCPSHPFAPLDGGLKSPGPPTMRRMANVNVSEPADVEKVLNVGEVNQKNCSSH